jgi:hypothetical protein
MKRFRYAGVLGFTLLAGFFAPAFGDGGCDQADLGSGRPFVNRAQAAEQRGDFEGAFKELHRVPACAPDVDFKQLSAVRLRVARRAGEQAEKAGRYESAASWFREAESPQDEDRAMDEWGKSATRDLSVFEKVYRYFEHGRPNATRVAELQRIAARNADDELAKEDKAFPTALHTTTDMLSQARQWLRYTDVGEKKAYDRAVVRGDTLARDESPETFRRALDYYHYANNNQRETALKDRARKLGDANERKGESLVAAQYYDISGDRDKSESLRKRTAAQMQKDESARRKKFTSDQKALEKELGL